jgi:ABC-type polysaccharide/polyol phosphate transport system ATPase subunit
MARIELERVGLTFRVRKKQGRLSLKEYLCRGLFLRDSADTMSVEALRDLTLRFAPGDRVGIIGHNGAGKSTLLKLLAGIYAPTTGRMRVEGKISALFDLMLGFESEATGWENIRYRGYLQGETPRSIGAKTDAIAEFTELGRYLDMPVRYYSAGMLVRLAFAIATAIDPEILLVDEVLGAGDMAFQNKARRRMREMMDRAQLIVCVTHDLGPLPEICNRGVWMERGQVRMVGRMQDVIEAYTAHVEEGHEALVGAAG